MIPARKHEAPKAAVKVDASGLATLEAVTSDQIEYSIDRGPWQTVKPESRAIGYLFEGRHEIAVRFVTPELDVLGPVHLECQVSTPMLHNWPDLPMCWPWGRIRPGLKRCRR